MTTEPILQVQNLRMLFHFSTEGFLDRKYTYVHAVDDVTFELGQGEILGLVGESGCGKSTLALTLLGLETATEGRISFDGREITHVKGKEQKELRRHIQMVFQDPYESLNPLMTIAEIVAEPLKVHGLLRDKAEIADRVSQALEDAGLKPADIYYHRYPHELSGGQRPAATAEGRALGVKIDATSEVARFVQSIYRHVDADKAQECQSGMRPVFHPQVHSGTGSDGNQRDRKQ